MTCHFCGSRYCKMVVETDQGDICRRCIRAAVEVIARMAGDHVYGSPGLSTITAKQVREFA